MKAFLASHWKKLLALALLLCAFAAGRYTTPGPKTVEVVKVQEKVVEKIVEVKVIEKAKETAKVTKRRKVTTPDGTTTEDTTVTVDTKEKQKEDSKSETASLREWEESGWKVVDPYRPQWRIGALLGAAPQLVPSFSITPLVGGIVERRIAGPLFLGAWGLSNGTFGVSLSVEF